MREGYGSRTYMFKQLMTSADHSAYPFGYLCARTVSSVTFLQESVCLSSVGEFSTANSFGLRGIMVGSNAHAAPTITPLVC